MPILKVFAGKAETPEILEHSKLIEKYDAFQLVEAGEAEAKALARKFPVEDITDQYEVKLGTESIPVARGMAARARSVTPVAKPEKRLKPGPHHYVVQFIGPVKKSWLTKLKAAGARLRVPHGSFGYVVWARESSLPKISALPFVHWLGHLPHSARVAPGLTGEGPTPRELPRRQPRPGVYTVQAFDGGDVGKIASAARKLGFQVLSKDPKARLLIVKSESAEAAQQKKIESLSAVHGIQFIRQRVLRRPSNNIATGVMGNAFASNSTNGLGLTGDGEIVAVCDTGLDTGDPATIHPDFDGRIVAIKSYPITPDWSSIIFNPGGDDGPADFDSGHGTHVSGSVLGNGTASAAGPAVIRGHAHKAKLVFQAVEQEMKWKPNAPPNLKGERFLLSGIPNDLGPLFQFAFNQGARIHSNSWGGGDPGAYDEQSRQFDQFVWDHKDFCFVIAAGNDGTDRDGDGKINLTSVTSPGTAKNCITVGACENLRLDFNSERYGDWWPNDFPVNPERTDPMANNPDQVVAFSSRGPTLDKRIKPDVLAPGTFILSTRSSQLAPNNFAWAAYPPDKKRYFFMGGTSMATPLTSGAVALVREFLRKKQGIASPSAALLKATLIAGAQRLPGTAPTGAVCDNHQGFGRVNLDRSFKGMLAAVDGPGLDTGAKSTATVKVTALNKTLRIALCYSDFPGETLVNNLNLIVTDPSGKKFVGNQSGGAGNSLTLDSTNNVELVQVTKAKKGTWTIDVVASNVASGPQDFAIAAVLV